MKQTVFYLGSSVTYGHFSNGISFVELLDYDFIKEAVSGTTLVDENDNSYISRMKKVKIDQPIDLFICQLSTNDATKKKELGTISNSFDKQDFDTLTIAGAMEYIIAYIKETYHCKIAFYTNPKYDCKEYEAMVYLLMDLAKKWDISIIDLWNDEEFNNQYKPEYMHDSIHPFLEGHKKWWLPKFKHDINAILKGR